MERGPRLSRPLVLLFFALVLLHRPAAADVVLNLEVRLADRQLHVKIGDVIARTYEVAVGTSSHPTPSGAYTLDRVIWNPSWHPPDSKWARGKKPARPGDPRNPIQVAKIPFMPLYHIHGTDKPESVGGAASHGCIRMKPEHVAELAQTLMEWTGQYRDPVWYDEVLRSRRSSEVELGRPVELVIR